MNQDRRRHLRKIPEKFAFVQIEGDEVGKVLNVSEGGLSFNTFAAVPQYGPLYFWFSFNLKDRIEGMAELAWTDSSRRMGGLRFVQLPQSSREQIHTWLSRMSSREVSEEVQLPRNVRKDQLAGLGARDLDRVARFVSKARSNHFPPSLGSWDNGDSDVRSQRVPAPFGAENRGDSEARFDRPTFDIWDRADSSFRSHQLPALDAEDRRDSSVHVQRFPAPLDGAHRGNPKSGSHHFTLSLTDTLREAPSAPSAALPGIESSGGLVPAERYHSAKKRQLLLGAALGVGISVAVAWAAVKYARYAYPAKNTAVASVESSLTKNDLQASLPFPQPAAALSSPTQNISPRGNQNSAAASKPAATKQVTPPLAYQQSPFQTPELKAPARAARPSGLPQMRGAPITAKKSSTPAQLWSAIQAGNTKAAVVLAEDYIRGEGVPKNCQQARILLLMASEKRNAAAIKRLQELDQDKDTCP